MNNPDHISESVRNNFLGLKILKFFDPDPGSRIWDPGWKKSDSGINIPDPQQLKKLP